MSSIGFLTAEVEVRVSGRENAKLRGLLYDTAWAAFLAAFTTPDGTPDRALIEAALTLPSWVTDPGNPNPGGFLESVRLHTAFGGGEPGVHSPTGQNVATVLDTHLNTVAAGKPAPVVLAVRIYGQCEMNAWIAGEDRAWAADLIEEGMTIPHRTGDFSTTLFSDDPHWRSHYDGWAAVAAMLRTGGTGPVVLDYSVTDGFPSKKWAAHPGEPGKRFNRWWNSATPTQRWDASLRGLQAWTETGPWMLRISPDNLTDTAFGHTEAWTWTELAAAWRTVLAPAPAGQEG